MLRLWISRGQAASTSHLPALCFIMTAADSGHIASVKENYESEAHLNGRTLATRG
ncbi:MAG: hypothetical protein KBS58_04885 [Bacteroidales bacterium]|nr:hypothetical protein [Candidatus Cacconaster equi]